MRRLLRDNWFGFLFPLFIYLAIQADSQFSTVLYSFTAGVIFTMLLDGVLDYLIRRRHLPPVQGSE